MERWREKVEEVEGGVEGKGVKLGCSLFTPKFSNLLNHSFPRKKRVRGRAEAKSVTPGKHRVSGKGLPI